MPNKALVLVAAAVLEARDQPSTYSSSRPGRQVPTIVDQVVSFSFTRVALVEAITDRRIFTLSEDLSGFADGWFDEGAITFEAGANTGRTIEVKSWTQGIRRLELWAPTGLR